MLIRSTLLLLATVAAPAIAQTAADAPAKPKADKKICRTIDTTGSIMVGTRVCHTKAEWAAIDGRNSDNVSQGRDIRGGGGSPRGL